MLIWTLPDKTSYWAKSRDQAISIVEKNCKNADVYVGVGLADKTYGTKRRATNAQITGIYGLWLDLDYADEVHSKKNLPSKDDALAFILALEKKPTLIIHSGHGYQCWWFFHDIWKFADASQRDYAAAIARAWIYKIREMARSKGWEVDSTIDLARVLRVPGTENHKRSAEPVPVEIVAQNNVRYYPVDFNGIKPEEQLSLNGHASIQGATFELDPQADPPASKWMALCDNDARALKTWKRERADFGDQSASSYDMSLSTIAALHNWTDQEIVNLLIANRRHHGDDLKLREDYYARTIARARAGTTTTRDFEESINNGNGEVDPEAARDSLSALFGVDIQKVTKFLGDPPTYMLTVARNGVSHEVTLGDVSNILSQRKFRNTVASAVSLIIPKVNENQWEKRAQVLLDSLEVADLGPESSPAGVAEQWVNEYLASHRPSEDYDTASASGRPFYRDGFVYIYLQQVAFWLRTVHGERMSGKELARMIKRAGWEQYTYFIPQQSDGTPATSKSYWRRQR